jgi:Galactose-3-O-sulfotransferase
MLDVSLSPACCRSIIFGVTIYTVSLAAFIQSIFLSYNQTMQVLSLRPSEMNNLIEETISLKQSYNSQNEKYEMFSIVIPHTSDIANNTTFVANDLSSYNTLNKTILDDYQDGGMDVVEWGNLQLASESILSSDVVTPIAFDKWNVPVPCYVPEVNWSSMTVQQTPTNSGIIFIKVHKAGSSTGSGINLRISRNLARRQQKQHQEIIQPYGDDRFYDICQTRFDHGRAIEKVPNRTKFNQINTTRKDVVQLQNRSSVLWSLIRDPTSRSISAFFHFAVSRQGVMPTDTNFIMHTKRSTDFYLRYLYTRGSFNRKVDSPQTVINSILNEYDFIGITERMDESAVVLMMLLNLKLSDVLYLRAKSQGGYDDGGGFADKMCTYITPTFVSDGMKEYFESDRWKKIIKYDQELYQAVNTSLDMTIESLGKDKFQKKLKKFRFALARVEHRCRNITVFPCDNMGNFHSPNETDCLWTDSGCGMECIDAVSTKLKLW